MARLGIGSHARPTVSNRSAWSWASRSSRTPVVCGRVPGPSLADRRWFDPPLTTASTAPQATVSQRQTQGRPQPHQAPPASRTVPLAFSRRYGVGAVGIMTQGKAQRSASRLHASIGEQLSPRRLEAALSPDIGQRNPSGRYRDDFQALRNGPLPAGGSRLAAFSPRARAGFAARQDLRSRIGAGNGGCRGLLRRGVPEVHQVLLKEPGSLGCDGQACYAAGIAE
jgi:hypothetical protein